MITYIVGLLVGVAWLSVEVAPVSCNPITIPRYSCTSAELKMPGRSFPFWVSWSCTLCIPPYSCSRPFFRITHINQIDDDDDDVHKVRYFTSSIIQIAHMGPSLLAQAKASSKK